ncbi:lmo0937 family membrane protein [Clostridium polynesiense]|nr:lmo0937 family membrane protein [Clostridium polynesiense]
MGFLRWIGGIILLIWLLGLLFKMGGSLIHLLLVIAVIVFIIDFLTGRRA